MTRTVPASSGRLHPRWHTACFDITACFGISACARRMRCFSSDQGDQYVRSFEHSAALSTGLFLTLALTLRAWADLAPPQNCTAPGQPCTNAGMSANQSGVCVATTCTRLVPADGGVTTMSYSCNRCQTPGGGGAGGGAGQGGQGGQDGAQNGTGGRGSGGVGGSTVDGGGVPDAAVDGRISGKDSGCSVGGGSPARGFGGQLFAGVVGLAGIFGFTFAVRRRERRPRS